MLLKGGEPGERAPKAGEERARSSRKERDVGRRRRRLSHRCRPAALSFRSCFFARSVLLLSLLAATDASETSFSCSHRRAKQGERSAAPPREAGAGRASLFPPIKIKAAQEQELIAPRPARDRCLAAREQPCPRSSVAGVRTPMVTELAKKNKRKGTARRETEKKKK